MIETITLVCGAILAVAAVIGLTWRIVKPWLREQLFDPIQQINQQVTVNGGKSDPPTLKDELSILGAKVDQLSADVRVLAIAFGSHLAKSSNEAA